MKVLLTFNFLKLLDVWGGADTLFCANKQVDHLPRSVFLTFNKRNLIAKLRFIPVQIKN